jgi:predicted cupin superfamily sugar epimerase
MSAKTAMYWIKHLALQRHPEGGYYKEVFRSAQQVNRSGEKTHRKACTSIYYLLEGEDYSGFHRILSDEVWYFHKGYPLHIHVISEQGIHETHELSDKTTGSLSVVVPAGLWFAAELPTKTDYCLVSCAVAPGFEFSEFEMADKTELGKTYSQYKTIFERLCR